MRILIVDDNEIHRDMVEHPLTKWGYQVVTARNGREAMDLVRQGGCRLVITDWEMPEMDGIDLCRAIRSEQLPGYVYVILLTAHSTPDDKIQALSAEADDFITKPFDARELIARVHTAERVLSLETHDVAIFAMAKLAESRDPETGAHLERVCGYSRLLAQQLARTAKYRTEINAEYIRLIYLTSPLHDIGKVGIPDNVLLKPGRLNDAEFEIMKMHAALGAQTLDAALARFPDVKFLQMARDIAATHHERFDGTGYPNKIAGCDIPLCGRIVALADVYDALTSKRVYKSAIHHQLAKSIIVQESGKQFDPDLVETFLQVEAEFAAIKERYNEAPPIAA